MNRLSLLLARIPLLLLLLPGAVRALTPAQVLVCYNPTSAQSVALKDHYVSAHAGVKTLAVPWAYAATADGFTCTSGQASALDKAIRAGLVAQKCDCAVLCRDLPGLIYGGSGSLDSLVMSDGKGSRANPYFSYVGTPFTHARFGAYLVTRLDGWSWEDANALIERAAGAVKGGVFLFDEDPNKTGGFIRWNNQLTAAAASITALGWPVALDTSRTFCGGSDVGLYASWGSNDAHYSSATFSGLRFRAGALACTAVSTSASHLRTAAAGQSSISTLVHYGGVTGVSGYVAEPFLVGVTDPGMLARAYLGGQSLAEAFGASAPHVGRMDVWIGDALCAPYK